MTLTGLLILAGLTLLIVADWGRLNGYHPLKAPETGQIRVACAGDSVTCEFGIPRRAGRRKAAAV